MEQNNRSKPLTFSQQVRRYIAGLTIADDWATILLALVVCAVLVFGAIELVAWGMHDLIRYAWGNPGGWC